MIGEYGITDHFTKSVCFIVNITFIELAVLQKGEYNDLETQAIC